MSFLHVHDKQSDSEYDAPEALVEAFPDRFKVVDKEPVLAPRPPYYFLAEETKPPRSRSGATHKKES